MCIQGVSGRLRRQTVTGTDTGTDADADNDEGDPGMRDDVIAQLLNSDTEDEEFEMLKEFETEGSISKERYEWCKWLIQQEPIIDYKQIQRLQKTVHELCYCNFAIF